MPRCKSRTCWRAFPARGTSRYSARAITRCAFGLNPEQGRRPEPDRQRRGGRRSANRMSRSRRARSASNPCRGRWPFELQINAKGRLFPVRSSGGSSSKPGPMVKRPCSRTSPASRLSADSYALRSLLDNKTAVALPIFQTPGANALQLSAEVRRTMERLEKELPRRRGLLGGL